MMTIKAQIATTIINALSATGGILREASSGLQLYPIPLPFTFQQAVEFTDEFEEPVGVFLISEECAQLIHPRAFLDSHGAPPSGFRPHESLLCEFREAPAARCFGVPQDIVAWLRNDR